VCLYDFVKWYTYKHTDASGNRVYQKLKKPCLPNHHLYNPSKENEREEYFFSLLPLFVPFRDEKELVEITKVQKMHLVNLLNLIVKLKSITKSLANSYRPKKKFVK